MAERMLYNVPDDGTNTPKSSLTVLNDEFTQMTGGPYYLKRRWNLSTRGWSYLFADGSVRVTYVGALILMRTKLMDVSVARADGKRQ